jgi:hypothetical protein
MERIWKCAAALAGVLLVAQGGALAAEPAHHSAKSGAASPALLGGKPNLNGVWQVMNTADWNLEPHDAAQAPAAAEQLGALGAVPPGLGVVEGGKIPYLPAAVGQRDANMKSAPKGDPEAACYLPGIPRATYIDHPFQIFQAANGDMLFAYEYAAANRTIYMKKVEVPAIDTWMGTSYGSWEGKTLKVVTLAQNGMTWLDRVGNYIGPNATVTERFTLKDADHISYEVTIDDPSEFSKPWKISMVLYRHTEPHAQLLDFRCVPFADLLIYGDLLQNKPAK